MSRASLVGPLPAEKDFIVIPVKKVRTKRISKEAVLF
jgi:hypothetical protein